MVSIKNVHHTVIGHVLKKFILVNIFKIDIWNFITKVMHEEEESRLSCNIFLRNKCLPFIYTFLVTRV